MARRIAAGIFILTLPVFLFAGNLIWVVLQVGTYEDAFFNYGAAARTGLSADELRTVATAFVDHFRDGTPLALTVVKNGQTVPMFTEREIIHMQDVHNLVHFGLRSLAVIALFYVVFALAGTRWWRGEYAVSLSRNVLRGAGLTIGLLAGIGLLTLFDFEQMFILFHVVSFPNDFWILDPAWSYLINLFAQDFFMNTTLKVAVTTGAEALLLAIVAGGVILWRTRYGPAGRERRHYTGG
ncbi:MAG: DUF1461 domain-containing protein [Chloroflexota bacterium]